MVPSAIETVQSENYEKQFLGVIDFPFNNEEFLMFQNSTHEFIDPEHIRKDT